MKFTNTTELDLSFQIGVAQSVERLLGLTLYAAEGQACRREQLSCHAGRQEVSRCCTRREYQETCNIYASAMQFSANTKLVPPPPFSIGVPLEVLDQPLIIENITFPQLPWYAINIGRRDALILALVQT